MTEEKHFDSIQVEFDPKTAYDFVLSSTTKVGHLLALSFTNAGKDLVADTPVSNPESPDEKISVVGIFDGISWEGAPTDPLKVNFRVSPANKATMQQALSSRTGGTEIAAKWVIYDYDVDTKKYFQHFAAEENVNFVITKGTKVYIDSHPDSRVQQPKNHRVSMSLTPKPDGGDQNVNVAYTDGTPAMLQMGIKVGA